MPNVASIGFNEFARDGFQILQTVIDAGRCDSIASELTPLFDLRQQSTKNKIGGVRNLLRTLPCVREIAGCPTLISLVEQAIGTPVFAVRAIFFDKVSEANWSVPWHQDLAIAVTERRDTAGFTGWSTKDGVLHVHPPVEILSGMITLRLHLDECDESNGALKVIPRSHRTGKLTASEIDEWTASKEAVICEVPKGGALLMSPLLLHASAPAESPRHRRVLHVEYATQQLPNGLDWFNS